MWNLWGEGGPSQSLPLQPTTPSSRGSQDGGGRATLNRNDPVWSAGFPSSLSPAHRPPFFSDRLVFAAVPDQGKQRREKGKNAVFPWQP